MATTMECSRCGRNADSLPNGLPEGWEDSSGGVVCPGCQFAEWHPHCTTLRVDGQRVDVAALERGEQIKLDIDGAPVLVRSIDEVHLLGAMYCGYLDLSVSWIDEADWPTQWTCPDCGGRDFEGLHRP